MILCRKDFNDIQFNNFRALWESMKYLADRPHERLAAAIALTGDHRFWEAYEENPAGVRFAIRRYFKERDKAEGRVKRQAEIAQGHYFNL
jgi:hypothetical protein